MINGVSDTIFNPNKAITRGEYVKLIATMANDNLSEYNHVSIFSDIDSNDWYNEYVAWAAKNEITKNCIKYNTNPAIAINATAGNLKRTQRAVAGLLYRFLIDTGREF